MKALSINQPWAFLIVNGFKGVENRDWDTRYRGEFLIHAGKKIDSDAYEFLEDMKIQNVPAAVDLPTGGIVGKARLINTVHIRDKRLVTAKDQPWFFGEYGFMLDSQEPCELIPCKGALGFFDPDYNSRYAEKKPKEPKPKKPETQGTLI
jgi:hypothetical protein